MKPGYGRKQQQEQHILINNNVRVDGTLINNKVDFTFGNNQLNDNNISKVGTSKSFFRIDSTYGPKFFHYHKVNQIIIRRPPLTTHQKNHCVINARERLKHIEDCTTSTIMQRNVTQSNLTILPSKSISLITDTWNKNKTFIENKIDCAFLIINWSKRERIH